LGRWNLKKGRRKMSILKIFPSVVGGVLLISGFVPEARADTWNKKTILTINEPIQVSKATLDPGKYVFKLADSQSNRHIVQIFNSDESDIITTVLAIPNYRLQVKGESEFTFWETPAGEPRALRAWFYPGDNFGHEFAYPRDMATRITSYSKEPVQITDSVSDQDLASAKVEQSVTEPGTVQQLTEAELRAQNDEPEPAPVAQAPVTEPAVTDPAEPDREQADRPAQAEPVTTLPETASYYPLIAMIGLLCLGAFAMMVWRT